MSPIPTQDDGTREKGIPLSTIVISLVSMTIVLIMAFIKIYISNKIYYESRTVNRIEANVEALREENEMLKTKLERLKYKSRITDAIFIYDGEEEVEGEADGAPASESDNP
jgi:hypothetical protein